MFGEKVTLLVVLDALGDRPQAELVRDEKHRGHDRLIAALSRDIDDEAAIDLDRVDGELLEVRERRLSGPEVVDGDRDSHLAQAAQNAAASLVLVDGDALGQLQLE